MTKRKKLERLWQEVLRNKPEFETYLEIIANYPSLRQKAWQTYLDYHKSLSGVVCQREINRKLAKIFEVAPELRSEIIELFKPDSADGNFPFLLLNLAVEYPDQAKALTLCMLKHDYVHYIDSYFVKLPTLIPELWPKVKTCNPGCSLYYSLCEHVPELREEAAEFILENNSEDAKSMKQVIIYSPKYRQQAWEKFLSAWNFRKYLVEIVLKVPEFSQPVFKELEKIDSVSDYSMIAINSMDVDIQQQALDLLVKSKKYNTDHYICEVLCNKKNQEVKKLAARAALTRKNLSCLASYYIICDVPEYREESWQCFDEDGCLIMEWLFDIIVKAPELAEKVWPKYKSRDGWIMESHYRYIIENYPSIRLEAARILMKHKPSTTDLAVIYKHVPEEREKAWQMIQALQPNQDIINNLCESTPELVLKFPEVPATNQQILAAMADI